MAVPVAIYGKDAKMAETVREKLLPDFDVHVSLDLASALEELPALSAGDLSVQPASGLGTNASATTATATATAAGAAAPRRKVPVAIFFGGGFSDDEFGRICAAVRTRNPAVRFVKCQKRDVLANGGFGPNPDVIAKVYRKKMAALAA